MRLILLGANDPEVVRLLRAVQRDSTKINEIAFLDNDAAKHGTTFFGYPVLGGTELVNDLADDNTRFVNLISSSTWVRHETTLEILSRGGTLGQLVHPNVDQSFANFSDGVYVQEAAIVQAHASLGQNSAVNASSIVAHETQIGESAFVAPGVRIAGKCLIGDGAFIGINATILPRLVVGHAAIVGAGAVVTRDVPDLAIVVGNPAEIVGKNVEWRA